MSRMSVARARAEHAALLRMAGEIESIAAGPVAPERAHASVATFVARLQEHRSEEQLALYDPLMRYAQDRSLELEAYLSKLLRSAATDWPGYVRRWTPASMEANWEAFAFDTRRILFRGRARLRLEDELLYPLAEREGILPAHG